LSNGVLPPTIVPSPTIPEISHVHSETIGGIPVYAGAIRLEADGRFMGFPVYQDRINWKPEIGPFLTAQDAAEVLLKYLFERA
jgi:hypothetical protein